MFLVVSDIEAARDELIAHGAEVSEVFHYDGDHRPVPGPDPKLPSYGWYASFSDPDGNRWVLQQVKTRLPGRGLSLDVTTLTELFARNREAPRLVRTDRSETPLVRLVRGLRGCARAREDSRRGRQRCNAPHRRRARRTGVTVRMRSDIGPEKRRRRYWPNRTDHELSQRSATQPPGNALPCANTRNGVKCTEARDHVEKGRTRVAG